MSLFFYLAIPVVLLLLLVVAGRRRSGETMGAQAGFPLDAEYLVRLPPRVLLDRCLSPEDLEFIEVLKAPRLLRLLVRERRRLALAWLRQMRHEAARLYRLHVRTARHAAGLRPAAEVRLFSAVGLFAVVYAAMIASVWLYGPFRTRRFLHGLQTLAGILSNLGGRIAESIGPVPEMHSIAGER